MPGLVICGYRLLLGSDDLVWSSVASAVVFACWGASYTVLQTLGELRCSPLAWFYEGYFIAAQVLFYSTCALNISLAIASSRGGVFATKRRRSVRFLLGGSITLFFFRFCLVGLGTFLAFIDTSACISLPTHLDYLFKALVVLAWLHCIGQLIIYSGVADCATPTKLGVRNHQVNSLIWQERIRFALCCGGGSEEIFRELGIVSSSVFSGTELTPSDVVAGLILLNRRDTELNKQDTENRDFSDLPLVSRETLTTLQYWMQYTYAAYGWKLIAFERGLTHALSFSCSNPEVVIGDNCCSLEGSLLGAQVNAEILHANFTNDVFRVPFFVALDSDKKALVIAVRGTMSFSDAITDLDANPLEISLPTDPPQKGLVHSGMWNASGRILAEIKEVLEKFSRSRLRGYDVIVTGHSLGAGVATMLAIRLYSQFPSLKCFSFSPPGTLVSSVTNEFIKRFTTSAVVGLDIVSRISRESIVHLQKRMNKELYTSPYSKHSIHCSSFCPSCLPSFSSSEDSFFDPDYDREDDAEDAPLLQTGTDRFDQSYGVQDASTSSMFDSVVEMNAEGLDLGYLGERSRTLTQHMYVPGNLIHILPSRYGSGEDMRQYRAIWSDASQLREVVVRTKMFTEHLPGLVVKALSQCLQHPPPSVVHHSHPSLSPSTLSTSPSRSPDSILISSSSASSPSSSSTDM